MPRLALGVLTWAVLSLAGRHALADCAMPSAFLSAPDGATLPPDPVLYAFVPAASGAGDAVETTTSVQRGSSERFGDMVVTRLAFAQPSGRLTVRIGRRTYRYRIRPDWARREARPRVESARAVVDSWMCSFTDAVTLPVNSRAGAFEVTWPGGRAIVPRSTRSYFARHAASRGTEGELSLGHVSCLGHTVPPPSPNVARPTAAHYRVTALYADGSRATVEVAADGDEATSD